MKHIRLIVLSLGVCACAGLGKLALSGGDGRAKPAALGSLEPQAAAKVAEVQAARAVELVYDVDFETKLRTNHDAAQTLVGSMTWTLSPLPGVAGKRTFWCRASAVSVVFDAGALPQAGDLAAMMSQDLERPLALELDAGGRVVRLGLQQEAGMIGLGIEKTLVAGLQFVRPEKNDKAWSTQESDHLGDFAASYHSIEGKGIEKTKSYSKLLLPEGLRLPQQEPTQVRASALFSLAAQTTLLPSRVELAEEVHHSGFVSHGKATLALTTERPSSLKGAPALASLRWVSLQDNPTLERDPERELESKRELLRGATFEQLLTDLGKLPAAGDTLKARHDALARLKALFDLEPPAIAEAVRSLKSGEAAKNASAILGALSDSSSSEARDALADLGKDAALPSELRGDAITNLALQPKPSPQTFDDLHELAKSDQPEVRSSAVLGLGATARSGAKGEDTKALAERATDDLAAGLSSAGTPEERKLYMEGLGNAGGPNALAAATAALQDPDPSVRAAAVASLRFAPAPQADVLIAQAWLKDQNADVRCEASFAASFRPNLAPLAEVAVQVLTKDSDVTVRLSVVALMSEHLEDQPTFTPALTAAVNLDASNDVKLAAARALGSTPPPAEPASD